MKLFLSRERETGQSCKDCSSNLTEQTDHLAKMNRQTETYMKRREVGTVVTECVRHPFLVLFCVNNYCSFHFTTKCYTVLIFYILSPFKLWQNAEKAQGFMIGFGRNRKSSTIGGKNGPGKCCSLQKKLAWLHNTGGVFWHADANSLPKCRITALLRCLKANSSQTFSLNLSVQSWIWLLFFIIIIIF